MSKPVAVIGAGAWGTAFSTLLAENGHEVNLWCYESEVVEDIKNKGINNKYLPGVYLDKKIKPTNNLEEVLSQAKWIFEAVPVKFLRNVLTQAKPHLNPEQVWVVLSKGIEQETLLLPSGILDDVFGEEVKKAAVCGPNFAKDLAKKAYTATTVASKDLAIAEELQKLLANSYFHPYRLSDFIGVQVSGAIKNLLALLVGIAKGAKCHDNTIAFLLTRGLFEIVKITEFYGGEKDTVYGLSGLGDLVLTSFGAMSRNQKVGMIIGVGNSLKAATETVGVVPEGVNIAFSVKQLIDKNKLDLPICQGAFEIIFEGKTIEALLDQLMTQTLGDEFSSS